MFCSQCGTKNNDDAKFCSSCGTAIAGSSETNREPQVVASPNTLGNSTESEATPSASNATASKGLRWTIKFLLVVPILVGGYLVGRGQQFEEKYAEICQKTNLQTPQWCQCVAKKLDSVLTKEQKDLAINGPKEINPSLLATSVGILKPTFDATTSCTAEENEKNFTKLSPEERCTAVKEQALKSSEQYLLNIQRGARGQGVPGRQEAEASFRNVSLVCGIPNYGLTELSKDLEITGSGFTLKKKDKSVSAATSTAEAVAPTARVKSSTEESYIKLREELLNSDWTAWTQPPINNWKAPFSEVMICDEGICKAYFSKRSDQNKLRKIEYGVCGWYEKYYDSAEDKKMCLGRKDFLVVLSDTLISTREGLDFYKSAKARFE